MAANRQLAPRLAKQYWLQVFALIGAALFLSAAVHAEERCPAEVKLLLSPTTTKTAVAALRFGHETSGRVYLFDTAALELLKQGVIIRVRQGAKNDLSVKVRLPEDSQQTDRFRFDGRFPCEIDRTRAGANISYAVARKYEMLKAPETGDDISILLSALQIHLLDAAQVSIDWARVVRIASINLTRWETTAQSPTGKLALELWEWPAGKILELSAKIGSGADAVKYAELERLARMNNLALSASQDTKTSLVLETLQAHTRP
jgi:hypothetical protein